MEINWTVISYFVVGLFALSGFFRGWWREAITFVLLTLLVFLLQQPEVADWLVQTINDFIEFLWGFIPASLRTTASTSLDAALGVDTGGVPRIDAADPTTWLVFLIITVAVAILISRIILSSNAARDGATYAPTFFGSILGGLLGGFNGFIILNLFREYLDGRNLPGGGLPTEISATSGNIGVSASAFALRVSDVPSFTILDSFIPWILMGIGALLLVILFRSRIGLAKSKEGYRRVDYRRPYGYREI